jgi:hypothetical protein
LLLMAAAFDWAIRWPMANFGSIIQ